MKTRDYSNIDLRRSAAIHRGLKDQDDHAYHEGVKGKEGTDGTEHGGVKKRKGRGDKGASGIKRGRDTEEGKRKPRA